MGLWCRKKEVDCRRTNVNSKIHVNLAFMLLLALVLAGSFSAQGNTAFAISDPNAAGASSKDGYTINVDLPQAVLHDVTITDTLPQGLIYKSDSLEVIGTANLPSETLSSPNDGSQPVIMTWAFGQLNKSDGQGLTLKFQPIVANVTSNRNGITLAPNRVSLQYMDDSGVLQTASAESSTAELVEPDLQIEMSASPTIGNVATYTASVTHSAKSDADAFDSDLAIVMPSGVVYSPGSAKILSGPTSSIDNTDPGKLKWHLGEVDQSWNSAQKIVLTFNATTERSVNSGEIVGILTWNSAPGDSPGTRSYVKTQLLKAAAAYTPNYAVAVNQIADPNPVEAGQILHYNINYSNTGNDDVHGVAIKDFYDQNVTYLSSIPLTSPGKGDSWTIGDLKPGESGDIIVEVRVNPSAADGTLLKNAVNMASTEASSEAIVETIVKGTPRNLTKAENKTLPQLGANNTSSIQMGNNSENNTTFDLKKLEIIPLIGANNTSSIQIGNNSLNNTTLKVIKIENHISVGANNTSSSQIAGNSENNTTIATTKLKVLPPSQLSNESSTQIGNNSKNNTAIATTKLDVLPLSNVHNESSTQMGNDSGNSNTSTPAKRKVLPLVITTEGTNAQLQAQTGNNTTPIREKQEFPSKIGAYEYEYKQINTNSENNTTSTPAKKPVPPQEATKKAETQTDTQSENDKPTILKFGDDIKVELVLQKTHLLTDYLVINKSDDISNKPNSETNQPDPAKGQTLGANQSNESIEQIPAAINKSSLATNHPDAVSNQTTLSDNQSDQSKGQTPNIEIKPELNINQSNTASNQPNIETNQSAKPKDQTPVVEIMPASSAVQPGAASNQTEPGASQSDKPKDQMPAVEIMPALPAIQPSAASNQTETAPSQSDKPKDQTPVIETKPTIQANQPNTIPAQSDNGVSTPDTLIDQTPVVESKPVVPASQPATVPTLSNVGASSPDTSMGQTPVVESKPDVPASQPATVPTLPNVGAGMPGTLVGPTPVIGGSVPAAPASQPSADLNQTK